MIDSEGLESHYSGDIVILNREPVGNPQSCRKGCKILIAKFHQRANIMQCYVQSTLFHLTQSKNWSILSLSVLLLNLTFYYLVCPSKNIMRSFFSYGEVLPPVENFYPKNVAESGNTLIQGGLFYWSARRCCFFSIDFIINTKTIASNT